MDISHRIESDLCIITLEGNANVYEVPDAKIYVAPFLEDPAVKGIIFNLKDIDFIDSSGIGFFIGIYKELKQREAVMGMTNLSQKNRMSFEMAGLNQILNLYENVDNAVAALK